MVVTASGVGNAPARSVVAGAESAKPRHGPGLRGLSPGHDGSLVHAGPSRVCLWK